MALVQPLIYGILLGGMLALAAVGFTLVYGVLDIVNVAHGVFIILGGYISFWLVSEYGVNWWLSLAAGFVILFALGYVLQRTLFQRVIGEKILYVLLVTFGVAIIGRDLMNYFWSPDYRHINVQYSLTQFDVLGTTVSLDSVIAFAIAAVGTSLIWLFLFRTKTGRAIRAVRDSDDLAAVYGVNTKFIYALTMGLSAGAGAVAGGLLVMLGPISPQMEFDWAVNAFIVVVLGGVGSVTGAFVGGLVLGLIINFASFLFSNQLSYAIAYTALFVMLLVKPTGFFGIEHELDH